MVARFDFAANMRYLRRMATALTSLCDLSYSPEIGQ